ncbi:MAG: transposase [Patescibacteria group bacterium]
MGVSKYKDSAEGAVYHLFNRGNRKQSIFEKDSDRRFYLSLLKRYCREANFSIIAYCLMSNHVHLLVRQNGEETPSRLIARLHTSYAMYFNDEYKKVGHLFQGRYKQKIVGDDNYLLQLISYLHMNPVKDNIVSSPEKYDWSSFGWYQQSSVSKQWGICDFEAVKQLGIENVTVAEAAKLAERLSSTDIFQYS